VSTVYKKSVRKLELPVNKDSDSTLGENSLCFNKRPLLDGISLLCRDAKRQGSHYYEKKKILYYVAE
jgi:hypothetical protein